MPVIKAARLNTKVVLPFIKNYKMSAVKNNTKSKMKIYHLLESTKSSIESYTRVDKHTRVRDVDKPNDRPFLRATFQDEEGNNRTIRFKMNCNSIWQDEQIEKLKIPANEPFSQTERRMSQFRRGVLATSNNALIAFLDAHPQNENFKGTAEGYPKLFKEYNPEIEKAKNITAFRTRLEAAKKISELELDEAQSMLIRMRGSFAPVPPSLDDCLTELIEILDTGTDETVDAILADGNTLEDEINILIGKALSNEIISFDEPGMENFVVMKKNGTVIPLKEIHASLGQSERKRFFADYMASTEGKLLLEDLRKSVAGLKKEEGQGKTKGGKKETVKKEEKEEVLS